MKTLLTKLFNIISILGFVKYNKLLEVIGGYIPNTSLLILDIEDINLQHNTVIFKVKDMITKKIKNIIINNIF